MSLPPERISVKRRRNEEPVETLVLEQSAGQNKKRRFTDFFFARVRVGGDAVPSASSSSQISQPQSKPASTTAEDRYAAYGIPRVKATQAGDEVIDAQKYKQSTKQGSQNEPDEQDHVHSLREEKLPQDVLGINLSSNPLRRFHLTRNISSFLKPDNSGGIRRKRPSIRPPLATFVERQSAQYVHQTESAHSSVPVDKIVKVRDQAAADAITKDRKDGAIKDTTLIKTFLKPRPQADKRGHSIRDDPSTWNHESDQLADELAALALEFDPDAAESDDAHTDADAVSSPRGVDHMAVDHEHEYVFETYIRVQHSQDKTTAIAALGTEVGVLVIDDEDQDLWEQYINSDDDDEWDEEDGDSNGKFHANVEKIVELMSIAEDNPRNDYPEDEVSTDDERRGASDGEEYDDEYD